MTFLSQNVKGKKLDISSHSSNSLPPCVKCLCLYMCYKGMAPEFEQEDEIADFLHIGPTNPDSVQ